MKKMYYFYSIRGHVIVEKYTNATTLLVSPHVQNLVTITTSIFGSD